MVSAELALGSGEHEMRNQVSYFLFGKHNLSSTSSTRNVTSFNDDCTPQDRQSEGIRHHRRPMELIKAK